MHPHRSARRTGALGLLLVAILAAPSTATDPSPTAPIPGAAVSYVALGDSYASGWACVSPCVPFPTLYAEAAADALGRPVNLTNLATADALETGPLLSRVQDDAFHRAALERADIITITVGWNDFLAGCTIETWPGCIDTARDRAVVNLDAILAAITALRQGQPTVIRVTAPFDPTRDRPEGPCCGVPADDPRVPELETLLTEKLRALDAAMCDVAVKRDATCLDLLPLLNGPDGTADAAPFLVGDPDDPTLDHVHLDADGHALVAQALVDLGFSPLE